MRLLTALAVLILWGLVPAAAFGQSSSSDETLSVQISRDSAALIAGGWIEFDTLLTNTSATATPPLVAHLNIAAVEIGPYVDPEDWSPQRTKYLAPIQPGASTESHWQVHALMEGEFASFVTIISADPSFIPVVSSSLLFHVEPENILPMSEVIPVAVLVPVIPLALSLVNSARAWRRKRMPPGVLSE